MAKYVHKRPDSTKFQFVLRVPSELVHRYPKAIIRKSLETSDPVVAMKRGDTEFARYQAEFARMRGDQDMTPAEVQTFATATAKELGNLEAVQTPRPRGRRWLRCEPLDYNLGSPHIAT